MFQGSFFVLLLNICQFTAICINGVEGFDKLDVAKGLRVEGCGFGTNLAQLLAMLAYPLYQKNGQQQCHRRTSQCQQCQSSVKPEKHQECAHKL